ncbi:unnamed protein product, partial [Hydatigera taeniaeformis]
MRCQSGDAHPQCSSEGASLKNQPSKCPENTRTASTMTFEEESDIVLDLSQGPAVGDISKARAGYIATVVEGIESRGAIEKEKALSEAHSKQISELKAQIESLCQNAVPNKEELVEELNELRRISQQQAEQIVTLEMARKADRVEEEALNEARLKIAELKTQVEDLRKNSEVSLEAHHDEELQREATDLRLLSQRQAERIVALEKSLSASKGCEKRDTSVDATARCREV